ncbi:endo-1-4-beta-mannosidase C [Diaporthe amygdali]|uniref:endo-1-4-beta-mannosidase C n=1 Tax=Phomopsis amygdali TaxID=1214568 RepID=UPI0022FEB815|nr:endo-1-4-beta-mannosidase C [Diaporthe amygdali]KAJ0121610.1 endo-1-4-beta-mannosidase C [Diaporthe amygdali]
MRLTSLLLAIAATASADDHRLRRHRLRARADTSNLPITRDGSALLLNGEPWKAVGPNVYWLGLDENVIPPAGEPFYSPSNASYPTKGRTTEVMAIVKALGGTMIRAHTLGVSTGNPLSVWPEEGVVNEQAFESIDWAVFQARAFGLRLLVPLTDNYDYYHGGKYNFLRWAGFNLTQAADANNPLIQQFYTNETIVDSFKEYIHTLLTHVNPYTNLTYAEDPTIFAYESGNELAGPVWADMNVPTEWVEHIAAYVKSLAPEKLFVDGTYGVNQTHLGAEDVDIFSDHFYPISIAKLQKGLDLVASVNKSYFAGEYDWVGSTDGGATPNGDSLADWFKVIEQSSVAAGDAFWSLFGHNVPDCSVFVNHTDGFTLQYGNPEYSPYTDSRIQLIHQHSVKLSQGVNISANASLPVVPCPASPDGGSRLFKR